MKKSLCMFLLFSSCSTANYQYACPELRKKGVPCQPASKIENMIHESEDPMEEDLFLPPSKDCVSCKGDLQIKKGFERIYIPKKPGQREQVLYFDPKDHSQFFFDEA